MGVRLLKQTDLTVDEVARQVGFHGRSNFYAAVRKRTGQTPREVRASRNRDAA